MKWNDAVLKFGALAFATLTLTQAQPAFAGVGDSKDVTEYTGSERLEEPKEKKDSLDATLSTAASVSLTSNKDVVGEIDGFSTLFSLGVTGGLTYINGAHLWQNTLTVNEAWARTPTLDQFVKNNDDLDYESLYNYFILKWFGPFARFNLQTSVFDTTVVTAEAKDYVITRNDGTTDTLTGVTEVPLSSSLEPTTFNESIGLFAEPVRSDPLIWKIRIGAGARETLADGVLAVKDDDSTDAIELTELSDVYQGGLEAFTGVEGKLSDGRFTYRAGASALLPFLNNDSQDRTAIDLLRWGLHAGLEASVVEWLSVNYSLNVLKDPQLLDVAQVQNNVLLTFKYTLIKPDKAPEPTPAKKAANLRKKAVEAEKKAAEFRDKAAAIEKKLADEADQKANAESSSDRAEKPADDDTTDTPTQDQ